MQKNSITSFDISSVIENPDLFKKYFQENGAAILTNINNDQLALDFSKKIGKIFFNPDADSYGITRVTNVDSKSGINKKGFTNVGLFPHTDRSSEVSPPDFVMLWCEKPAEQGGDTLLVDGKSLHDKLSFEDEDLFSALTKEKSVIFSSGDNFYHGSILEKKLKTMIRFRYDELGYFNRKMIKYINKFIEQVEELSIKFKLNSGEGYIVSNTRWLHGREAFIGERKYNRLHIYLENESDDKHIYSGFDNIIASN